MASNLWGARLKNSPLICEVLYQIMRCRSTFLTLRVAGTKVMHLLDCMRGYPCWWRPCGRALSQLVKALGLWNFSQRMWILAWRRTIFNIPSESVCLHGGLLVRAHGCVGWLSWTVLKTPRLVFEYSGLYSCFCRDLLFEITRCYRRWSVYRGDSGQQLTNNFAHSRVLIFNWCELV